MPPATRNVSKQPRKRQSSVKARENAEIAVKPPPKRVKKKKSSEIRPRSLKPPSSSDSDSDIESIRSIDVSDHQYTLSTCCMLNKDEFLQDSDYLKLREWSYNAWNVQCIRKLEKASELSGFDPEWVSGRAVISARGVAKANALAIAVDDDTCWKKVERFIESWMKQGKQEITVKLTTQWKKKKGNIELLDDDDESIIKHKNVVYLPF